MNIESYWDMLEKHLPNYSSRSDILQYDNLIVLVEEDRATLDDIVELHHRSLLLATELYQIIEAQKEPVRPSECKVEVHTKE